MHPGAMENSRKPIFGSGTPQVGRDARRPILLLAPAVVVLRFSSFASASLRTGESRPASAEWSKYFKKEPHNE
jgi:hypothetical protein